jgi:hypothetical protein
MLNRDQFCKLTKLGSIDALKARARRRQLPFVAESALRKSYGYSWFDAFITIVSENLAGEPLYMSPVAAASIARRAAPALAEAWTEIVASADRQRCGSRDSEIEWLLLFGTIYDAPLCLVGTASEIAAARGSRTVVTQVGASASRSAAVMLMRADSHGITIPDEFWTEKPSFLAGDFEPPEKLWDRTIADVNAKFEVERPSSAPARRGK